MLELRSAEACALLEGDRPEADANFVKVAYDLFGDYLRDEHGRMFMPCTEVEAGVKLSRAFSYVCTSEAMLARHIKMDFNNYPTPHEPGND
ncbi:hypothetical protein ACFQ61_08110 [Streptomyces sp. NPDC056500]|uniref:hypothetical protein n=1 Tax=Streptomyces sp. NPDC056500 TaxID=3345840 RepID=UPI00369BA6D8